MLKVCSFGEIIVRLIPSNYEVFNSLPQNLDFYYGGPEINFLANMSKLGSKTYFISALPKNALGDAILKQLDKIKISKDYIQLIENSRLGINFIEEGFGNRESNVIYDVKDSAINQYKYENIVFDEIFSKNDIYHISAITPALSKNMLNCTLQSLKAAKKAGIKISFDLYYNTRLWDYKLRNDKVNSHEMIAKITEYCDYLFGNEIDYLNCFNLHDKFNTKHKLNDISYYENLLLNISKIYPHIKVIAIFVTKAINPNAVQIGGVLYIRESNQFCYSPNIKNIFAPYLTKTIYSKIGTREAFGSGLIYGLNNNYSIQSTLDMAVASSIIKHTFRGDINYAALNEIQAFLNNEKNKIKNQVS